MVTIPGPVFHADYVYIYIQYCMRGNQPVHATEHWRTLLTLTTLKNTVKMLQAPSATYAIIYIGII